MADYAMAANGRGIVHEVTGGQNDDGAYKIRCGRPGATIAVNAEPGRLPEGLRMCATCTMEHAAGEKTSMWLPRDLHARRCKVKELTGYPDSHIMDVGLRTIEQELAVIEAAADVRRLTCGHAVYYPNGRCRHCYEPRPEFTISKDKPRARPGALFGSARG